MRSPKFIALIAALILAAAMWQQHVSRVAATAGAAASATHQTTMRSALPSFLPPQARDTLAAIAAGGPFSHDQDGVVFGNYEGLLRKQPRGYYHEYTVETPGARTRGTRRIITGGNPPTVYYYTADHYRSFQRFEINP